jgi:hypothetical protein
MPQLRRYGNAIAISGLGPRQTVVNVTSPTAIAPIQVRRYARPGMAPQSDLVNRVREAANFAALYRSKQVWGGIGLDGGNAPAGGSAGATVVCHRFACHSGPYTHAFLVKGVVYPPLGSATQAKVTVNVYSDTAMTALVSSAVLYYGAKPSGISFGWRLSRVMSAWVTGLSPDTDYYCTITATDSCKLGGLAISDMQALNVNGLGYFSSNLTMHSPIVYTDRQQPHTALKKVWTRGGSHVLNWSTVAGISLANDDSNGLVGTDKYVTSTSATLTNLIDRTSTTVSASTPGYTLDMTYKDRVSQTSGVPCVMKVWGYNPAAPGLNDGTVVLKNSAGTTIATVTGFAQTASWISTTFNMPATVDKYDLQFATNHAGNRFYVGAVSIWEQE